MTRPAFFLASLGYTVLATLLFLSGVFRHLRQGLAYLAHLLWPAGPGVFGGSSLSAMAFLLLVVPVCVFGLRLFYNRLPDHELLFAVTLGYLGTILLAPGFIN